MFIFTVELIMLKGYIYLIYNEINDALYVGLTSRTILERFNEHKKETINNNSNKLYTNMRNVGIKNCKITCLEEFEFDGINDEYFKQVLKKLEDKWITRIKPTLNTILPNENDIIELNSNIYKYDKFLPLKPIINKKETIEEPIKTNIIKYNPYGNYIEYINIKTNEIIEFKLKNIIILKNYFDDIRVLTAFIIVEINDNCIIYANKIEKKNHQIIINDNYLFTINFKLNNKEFIEKFEKLGDYIKFFYNYIETDINIEKLFI